MSRRNILIITALIVFLGILLFIKKTSQPTPVPLATLPSTLLGVYEGTLPCADCPGLQTKLTLNYNKELNVATTYTLEETYIDRNDNKPYITTGKWEMAQKNQGDLEETIYILNSDKPKEEQSYYLKASDTELKTLDSQMQPIDSLLNFSLKKID